ncbi:hypothetical protein BDW42DRAFT_111070 [Aspergillus taichungensis]|uniref:Zn(2)-C6 fungal-type domain-containing protein n=1 Tax=Aspergillus taichungensis TaxID=482145 RepID=A0A2J5HT83_9EURO|nr:hypothetical protein BDW42DRAFT_111070 [Aspergillus taichungensis]
MAHPYYSPEGLAFEHQHRTDGLPMAHSMRDGSQPEMLDRSVDCVSPSQDSDGKTRNSTRRRIQVACNRCRKRKIKCSGDAGDGQGCTNCRMSGNHNCQFLRVNSSALQTKTSGWPYPIVGPGMSPSQRYGLYPPVNHPGLRTASFSRPSGYDLGTVDSQQQLSRASFTDPLAGYEIGSSAYQPQTSTYMVPGTPQGDLADLCGFSWASKTWSPSLHASRGANGTVYPDQESENLAPTAYPYMFSGPGSQSVDLPPAAQVIPSMPSENQGVDRTLPSPTSQNSMQMGLPASITSPEPMMGMTHAPDHRGTNAWTTKCINSNRIRTSHQSTNEGAFTTSPARTKPIPSTAQELGLGFVPTSSPLISAGGPFAPLYSVDPGDELRSNGHGRVARTFSHDAQRLFPTESGSDLYGYSSSEKRHRSTSGNSDSVATLINGFPYTRPKHSGPQPGEPYIPVTLDTAPDCRTPSGLPRASMSALSSPDGF